MLDGRQSRFSVESFLWGVLVFVVFLGFFFFVVWSFFRVFIFCGDRRMVIYSIQMVIE